MHLPAQRGAERSVYDEALAIELAKHSPDLVVLAGFMRIFTPQLVARFAGRMLNIHPSLLPKYPGLDTHRRVLDERRTHPRRDRALRHGGSRCGAAR